MKKRAMVTDQQIERLVEAIINAAMVRVATIVSVAATGNPRDPQPVTMEVARVELREAIRSALRDDDD
jgi:hypothetical protein